MVHHPHTTAFRSLAIAPSTRGLGYAVLEGPEKLVDWGVKTVKGDKNPESLKKLKELILYYQPRVLILEDYAAKGSFRSSRIKALGRQIMKEAKRQELNVVSFSREQVSRVFVPGRRGTKHAVAAAIAFRFPEELGHRLPPERKAWMSEDYRMNIFDAVGLTLVFWSGQRSG